MACSAWLLACAASCAAHRPATDLAPVPLPPNHRLPQPEAPSTSDVCGTVQQAIEEARRLPDMPPFVDYSGLLADVREWVEQLQGAARDISAAQQVGVGCMWALSLA